MITFGNSEGQKRSVRYVFYGKLILVYREMNMRNFWGEALFERGRERELEGGGVLREREIEREFNE